jgi:hypothetical protein
MQHRQLVLHMNDDFGVMDNAELATLFHDLAKYFRFMPRTIKDRNITVITDEIAKQLADLECYVGQFNQK